jgi:hypothetical protein
MTTTQPTVPTVAVQPVPQITATPAPIVTTQPQQSILPTANLPASNVAPPVPPRNPKRTGTTKTIAQNAQPGLPPLLQIVANKPFSDIERNAASQYIPNSLFMFHVLDKIDDTMVRTYRFYQNAPAWSPLMSHYYYSVLYIYHILRCRSAAGVISHAERDALEDLELRFTPDSLYIAAPLVPFFSAITTFEASQINYGDICPALPSLVNMTEAGMFQYGLGLDFIFPNPLIPLDQMISLRNGTFTDRRNMYHDIFSVAAAAALPANIVSAYSPHVRFGTNLPDNQFQGITDALTFIDMPNTRLIAGNPGVIPMTWTQVLGLENTNNEPLSLFSEVSSIMARYSQFTKGNKSLATISPIGLASPAVIGTLTAANNAHLRAAVAIRAAAPPLTTAYRHAPFRTFTMNLSHQYYGLSKLEEQYGQLTATGISFPPNFNNNTVLPADLAMRSGPFWNIIPDRRNATVNHADAIAANLSSHYMIDARANV